MKESYEIVDSLLEKYRFTEPLPPEVQKGLRRIREREFNRVIRSAGGGSLFFSAAAYLHFTFKKVGVTLSLTKSAAILTLSGILAAGAVAAGLYGVIRTLTAEEKQAPELPPRIESPEKKNNTGAAGNNEKPLKKSAPVAVKRMFAGVGTITGSTVTAGERNSLTKMVYHHLKNDQALIPMEWYRKKGNVKFRYLLLGEVDRVSGTVTLSLRIVDAETGRIAAYLKDEGEDIEELKRKLPVLAEAARKKFFSLYRKAR